MFSFLLLFVDFYISLMYNNGVLVGKHARLCEDYSANIDNTNLFRVYYLNKRLQTQSIDSKLKKKLRRYFFMENLEFFKRQAKQLLKDYEVYCKKYNKSNNSFTLMNAQHDIAQMVGFKKWNDMLSASQEELEKAKALLLKRLENNNQKLRTCSSCKHFVRGNDGRSNYCRLTASKEEIDFKESMSSLEDMIDAPDEIYNAWQSGTLTEEAMNNYLEERHSSRNKK